jgi:ferrous iron transport protein A
MNLLEVSSGKRVKVVNIKGGFGIRNRFAAMGIYPGAEVTVVKSPPGPMIVEIAGTRLALGKGMAAKIEVEEV